jgi:MarR family transcriptional regulator, organic hydroperoxide resistance regulator
MVTDKENLNLHILQIVNDIYKLIGPAVPDEWLSSDLTVTQLRLLLVLQNYGPLRMSDIAANLQVTLPTTTIIVDNLVRKNLVQREANPQDRRLVICKLAPDGELLISKLWGSGQMVMRRLLDNLSYEETQKAAEVAELLYQAAQKLARANQ